MKVSRILLGVAIFAAYAYMFEKFVTPTEFGETPVWAELSTLIVLTIVEVLIYTGLRKKVGDNMQTPAEKGESRKS